MPSIITLLKRRDPELPIRTDHPLATLVQVLGNYVELVSSPINGGSLHNALRLNAALRLLDLSLAPSGTPIACSRKNKTYYHVRPNVLQLLAAKTALQHEFEFVGPSQSYLCSEEVGRALSVLDYAIEKLQVRARPRADDQHNYMRNKFATVDTELGDAMDDIIAQLAAHRRQMKNESETDNT